MVSTKHTFWQALVFTIFIFGIGMVLGVFLENSRSNTIESNILKSEINLFDQQLRSKILESHLNQRSQIIQDGTILISNQNDGVGQFEIECETATQSTFSFADKIYSEVLQLEKYDSNSKFDADLKILHRRYDLLRTVLWLESIDLKKQCNGDFHTVVYFFEYASEEIPIKAKQASISRLLIDLKEKYGSQILLIPIAGNLDLESINLIKQKYGISKLPVLIIDEEKIIKNEASLDQIEAITLELPGFEDLEASVFEKIKFAKPEKNKIFLN